MKEYRLLSDDGYYANGFTKGNIYKENEEDESGLSVKKYVDNFPQDWKEVIKFDVKKYLVNILNNEELYIELENVEELEKLFEIIERLRFSLNKKLETKENKIKVTTDYGKQVCFNLSKGRLFGAGTNNPSIKLSKIIEYIKQQVNK